MYGVEQDGARTDERIAVAGWMTSMRPASRIVLRTLLVGDVGLLLAVGALCALYVQRPAGFVFAGACWALAALLLIILRLAEWRMTLRRRSAPRAGARR